MRSAKQTGAAAPDQAIPAISLLDTEKKDIPELMPGGYLCAAGRACQSGGEITFATGKHTPVMWTCTSCIKVDFCEDCYNAFTQSPVPGGNGIGADENKRLFICDSRHEFVKTPTEGWEGMRDDGVCVVAGKEIRMKGWLDGIEAEFMKGQVSNAYHKREKHY